MTEKVIDDYITQKNRHGKVLTVSDLTEAETSTMGGREEKLFHPGS